jgi:hypothetical protein
LILPNVNVVDDYTVALPDVTVGVILEVVYTIGFTASSNIYASNLLLFISEVNNKIFPDAADVGIVTSSITIYKLVVIGISAVKDYIIIYVYYYYPLFLYILQFKPLLYKTVFVE